MNPNALARWAASLGAAAIAVALLLWSDRHAEPPVDEVRAPPPQDTASLCAQRLDQLGKALRLYADDNAGAFPVSETPADADTWLPKRLGGAKLAAGDLRCPSAGATGPPYVYHCYQTLGGRNWPRWMALEHVVTLGSPPETWLASDALTRDGPGPHSATEKAFNYLAADGRVAFHTGRPRDVYR